MKVRVCVLEGETLAPEQEYLLNNYYGESNWEIHHLESKKDYSYYEWALGVRLAHVDELVIAPGVPLLFIKLAFISGKEVKVLHEIVSIWTKWELI